MRLVRAGRLGVCGGVVVLVAAVIVLGIVRWSEDGRRPVFGPAEVGSLAEVPSAARALVSDILGRSESSFGVRRPSVRDPVPDRHGIGLA